MYIAIPFYLQSQLIHSASCVEMYVMACRRVLSSTSVQLIVSRPLVACFTEYKFAFVCIKYKNVHVHSIFTYMFYITYFFMYVI
jgi:hypothetical protein